MAKQLVTVLRLDDKQFRKGFSDNEKTVLAFSAAAAASAAAVVAAAQATANFQDATIKASRVAGIAVEKFSALSVAAQFSGATQEQVVKALGKLAAITPEVAKKLDAFGVSVRNTDGSLKSNDRLLEDIADRMQKMQDPADRTAFAIAAFGEEGAKLVNVLKDGSAGLRAFQQEAERAGLIVTERAGVAAEIYNDNLTRLNMSAKGLMNTLAEVYIEFANETGIVNSLSEAIQDVTAWIRDMDDGTKRTIVSLAAAAATTATVVGGIVGVSKAISTATSAMDSFKGMLRLVGIQATSTMAALGPLLALQGVVIAITFLAQWQNEKDEERAKKRVDDFAKAYLNLDKVQKTVVESQIKNARTLIEEYERGERTYANTVGALQEIASSHKVLTGLANTNLAASKTFLEAFEKTTNKVSSELSKIDATARDIGKTIEKVKGLGGVTERMSTPEFFSGMASGLGAEISKIFDNKAEELAKLGDLAGSKFAKAVADNIRTATSIVNAMTSIFDQATQNALKAMEQRFQTQEWMMDLFSKLQSKKLQEEIDAFRAAEDAKIAVAQESWLKRAALLDEESAAIKAKIEAEFALKRLQMEEDWALKQEENDRNTEDELQRVENKLIMEEDLAQQLADLERQKNDAIQAGLEEANASKETEKASHDQAIAQLEADKNAKIDQMEAQKAAKEKATAKAQAFMKWQFEKASLEASKQMQVMNMMASASASSVQITAGLLASAAMTGGIFAIPGAMALAGILSAMILGNAATSAKLIMSQTVLPPAELFMADGGVVPGRWNGMSGTAGDTVPARLTPEEYVMPRDESIMYRPYLEAMRNGSFSPGGTIMQDGAVQIAIYSNDPYEVAERVSEIIFDRARGRITGRVLS